MHHRFALPALLLVTAALGASACDVSQSSPAAPSGINSPQPGADAASIEAFLGVWRSEAPSTGSAAAGLASTGFAAVPELRGCWNFQWDVTSQTTTTLAGNLSVECGDGITLVAAANGTLTSAATADLVVAGTGDVPGVGACPFSLDGRGELLDPDTLRITYTGTTCLGPVTGDTTLYRHNVFPEPEPEPEPQPEPAPAPPANPRVPCASNNGSAIVRCLEGEFPDRLAAGVSLNRRIENMKFLRDRIIEAGLCGGLDLAWNLKRGVGPHSIDALAWRRPGGHVDVVDIGAAYDDTSRGLRLSWQIVAGPPGYDRYPKPGC